MTVWSDRLKFCSDCVPPCQNSAMEQRGKCSQPNSCATDLCSGYRILIFPHNRSEGFRQVHCFLNGLMVLNTAACTFCPVSYECWGMWRLLALLVEFIYLFIKGGEADIFKKQIVKWRGMWIIAFSFLPYGTNWISGEVGWELPFKQDLLLVGLANCLAHIKDGNQAITLHLIYIHKPYTDWLLLTFMLNKTGASVWWSRPNFLLDFFFVFTNNSTFAYILESLIDVLFCSLAEYWNVGCFAPDFFFFTINPGKWWTFFEKLNHFFNFFFLHT